MDSCVAAPECPGLPEELPSCKPGVPITAYHNAGPGNGKGEISSYKAWLVTAPAINRLPAGTRLHYTVQEYTTATERQGFTCSSLGHY